MIERNQLKNQGIRYARSLQMLFKTVAMFSADHSAATQPLQTSFDMLNNLVKQVRQFTIGFVDQRIMLNNILTTERSLNALENEFLKRGIGAVTFEAGMTLAGYKRAIAVLTRSSKVIEEAGGLLPYLEQNPVEFMRIFPASKGQTRTESGDTILEMDSESYLMAKAFSDLRTPGFEKMEWLLAQTGGTAPGTGGGPGGGPGGGGGSGGGGGGEGFGTGEGGPGAGFGGPGTGLGGGEGSAPGGGGSGEGSGTGEGGAGGGLPLGAPLPGYGTGSPIGPPGSAGAVGAGGPDNITRMVEGYFESSMLDPKDAPQRSYTELARVIREMRPEFVLSAFPPARREELRQLPPDQMAAEIIEDTAVKWAAERLVTAPTGADAVIVEEEVIRVLLRSLQATQAAGRLAGKLATIIKDYQIPKSTYERIQDELHWIVIPPKEKIERLLQMQHLTVHEFRRLLELLTELIKQGELDSATKLGNHYFTIFEVADEPEPQEISRIPDLLRTMAGVHSEFWQGVAVRLCDVLNRWPDKPFLHQQILNALIALCRTVALYEDFDLIQAVSAALDRLASSTPDPHATCCTKAMAGLLTPNSVERVIEIFIQRRDDRSYTRLAADLLRGAGPAAMVKVFRQLEEEQTAGNRLALIRLITKIGTPALDIARQRLGDERWYVVRNACKLLGDLKDPELLKSLAPALRHPNERVQKAAVTAILDSRDPGRAAVFSEALPHLHHLVVEDVLGELLFLKDPLCLPALERFIFRDSHGKTRVLVLAVQALSAIPGPQAEHLLAAVMADDTLDPAVRRVALGALSRIPSTACEQMLRDFAANAGQDPLAAECARTLAAMGR